MVSVSLSSSSSFSPGLGAGSHEFTRDLATPIEASIWDLSTSFACKLVFDTLVLGSSDIVKGKEDGTQN